MVWKIPTPSEEFRKKVMSNKAVQTMFKIDRYLEFGKGIFAKITNPLNEVASVTIILTFVFDVDIGANKMYLAFGFLAWLIFLIIIGRYRFHSGLMPVELYVQAELDPVQSEILESARIIKKRFDLDKDDKKKD